ncbi:Bacterial leucyl aminopeptidase [bacterium HR11]|nr:Bacterial leucyl aminopeptidase [bacterium HR11]
MRPTLWLGLIGFSVVTSMFTAAASPWPTGFETAIRIEQLRADLQFLADDLLEGRAPGTRGDRLAARYIATRLAMMGLEPLEGAPDYLQPVPMVGVTARPEPLRVEVRGQTLEFQAVQDFVVWSGVYEPAVSIADAPLVFVGYGIEAPEYRWDDYKGQDMRGKVLVMLVNDPPAPPSEPNLFEGKAMTYYGRWTYKFEEAYRKGALGAFVIHVPDMAGYPWQVVQSSWTGEQVHLDVPGVEPALPVKGWIQEAAARRILQAAGYSLDDLLRRAARRDFRPIDLGVRVTVEFHQEARRFTSQNVAAVLRGADPDLQSEAVLYTAHFDHLGIGPTVQGDSIYNGAYDNASGVAAVLGVAEVYAHLARQGIRPRRSVLFLMVTAEEAGLLGSLYYASRPLWPLDKTVANINLDGVNVWGPTEDFVPLGMDRTTMDEVLQEVARAMGVTLRPDPFPEKGYFFRSDHFSLARKGVPAVSVEAGTHYVGKPPDWGEKLHEEYIARHYHQPSDQYDPAWPLTGMAQTVEWAFRAGWLLATRDARPVWKPGRAVRVPGL